MFTIHNKPPGWGGRGTSGRKKKALTASADCIYCQFLIISLNYGNQRID